MDNLTIGILAHVDAGKTTLSEAMLFRSGSIRKLGRVDHKDAFLDTYELERTRGITIFSKMARFTVGSRQITLLDTPGHVDFSAEMERTLKVLDYAVLVISGPDGIQGHTETLWKLLGRYGIPTFLFINKMDQPTADREALLKELKERLDAGCVDFGEGSDPQARLEDLALCDDKLLDIYMETGEVDKTAILELIRSRQVFPCYFGSALKVVGVDSLLEGFVDYMEPAVYPDSFGARVYKISRDDRGERLTFLKVTGGRLAVKDAVPVHGSDGKEADGSRQKDTETEKINQIRLYSGAKFEPVQQVEAGTICAVTGLTKTAAGQGLGDCEDSPAPMLEPVLSYRLILPEGVDTLKAMPRLRELEEEEPMLHIVYHASSGQIHVQLMGEIQTEVLKSMIEDRFGMKVEFGAGQIMYKETIRNPVIGIGHYEPLRHYAEVQLLLEPLERGSGLVFASACSEDDLDRNWQRLILTHLMERDHPGVLTGSPITDMKITLVAGRAHLKHTEGGDFRQSTYRAVRQGLKRAENLLLEPYYSFTLEVPSDQVGRAMADIQKMSGSFQNELTETALDMTILRGTAPAVEMTDYQKEVLAYTGGRGRIAFSLKGYEPCHNEAEVLEAVGYDSEHDVDNPTGSIFCAHGAGYYVPWDQVEDHAHLQVGLAERPSEKTGPPTRSRSSHYVEDAAFQAIYEREFGSARKEADRYSGFRRQSDPSGDGSQTRSGGGSPRRSFLRRKDREGRKQYLLVDGYNIIFSWDFLRTIAEENLDAARQKLLDILANFQGFTGCTLIAVFDAYKVKGGTGSTLKYGNIYVVYTKEAETADQYIEKTTHEIAGKHDVLVATSDGVEQVIVMGAGGRKISAEDFLAEVRSVEEQIHEITEERKLSDRNYLFDALDEELARHMEEVRLGRKQLTEPEEE